jgi:hypothetical protein
MLGSKNTKFHKTQNIKFKEVNPKFLEAQETLVIQAVNLIKSDQSHGILAITPNIHDHTKNPYSNRILDALARLFYVKEQQKPHLGCCAVSLGKKDGVNKIYVSYNSNPDEPVRESVGNLLDKINSCVISNNHKDLVAYCLEQGHYFYCQEYKNHVNIMDMKSAIHGVIEEFNSIGVDCDTKEYMDLVAKFLNKVRDLLPKNFNELTDGKNTIKNEKENLINSFKNKMGSENEYFKEIEDIINTIVSRKLYFLGRLEHDCCKIVKYFKSSILASIKSENICFIPNKDKNHCELNILAEQKKDGDIQYVGISKPSCFTCDTQFRIEEKICGKILHAGSSGIVYPINSIPHIFLGQNSSFFNNILGMANQVNAGHSERKLDPADQYPRSLSPIEELMIVGDDKEKSNEFLEI